MIGPVAMSFNKKDAMPGINISKKGAKYLMKSKYPIKFLPMAQMRAARASGEVPDSMYQTVPVDSVVPFQIQTLYIVDGNQFVFSEVKKHSSMQKIKAPRKNMGKII